MALHELYLNMNIVRLRHSLIYKAAVRLTNNLAKVLPMKLWTELLYWRLRKLDEGDLTNEHYEEFFTVYFGLSVADYKGKRVLDIGCGPRGSLEWVSAHADCFCLASTWELCLGPNLRARFGPSSRNPNLWLRFGPWFVD